MSLHKAVLLPQCLPWAAAGDAPGIPGAPFPARGCAEAVTLSKCHLLSILRHKRWQLLNSHCSAVVLLLFSLAEVCWLG